METEDIAYPLMPCPESTHPGNETWEENQETSKKDSNNEEDGDYVEVEDIPQSELPPFEVEDLPQPEPPPAGDTKDERVLCIDLHRKTGEHDTVLRVDQKRALHGVMCEQTDCTPTLIDPIVERIFGFLPKDTHVYEDQYLCETSLFMAALLGCNTNVSVLGGSAQALNALFYLVGYLTKNPVKPNVWTTCVAAALQSAQKHESVAEDKDTPARNAKFILQKVLNRLNALAEMSDTQLSMLLLNFTSFKCSHRFSFCFRLPALEAQLAVRDNDSTINAADSADGSDVDGTERADESDVDGTDSADGLDVDVTDSADGLDVDVTDSADGSDVDGTESADGLDVDVTDSDDGLDVDGTESDDGSDLDVKDSADGSDFDGTDSADGSDVDVTDSADVLDVDATESVDGSGLDVTDSDDGLDGDVTDSDDGFDIDVSESVDGLNVDVTDSDDGLDVDATDSADGSDNDDESDVGDGDNDGELTADTGVSDDERNFDDVPKFPARGNIIFRTKDDKAIALSQHDLYRYRVRDWNASLPESDGMSDLVWWCVNGRGCNHPSWRRYQQQKGLHDFNLMEYVRHIVVVEMPDQLPSSGQCQYYFFSDDCPIKDSHIQKLHSKHLIAAVSGKPPQLPGKIPRRKSSETQTTFKKRMLVWRLKADLYGQSMGALLVPWDRRGDCNVHTYEDFMRVVDKWDQDVKILRSDRQWRNWIFRDRDMDDEIDNYPDADVFPDPRSAARLSLTRNLGVNMRVSPTMRKIANRWRYQNSDRFEDYEEYHECHGGDDNKKSELDANNALAISALLETMNRGTSKISGLDAESSSHLCELTSQISALYPGRPSTTDNEDSADLEPVDLPTHISSHVDLNWFKNSRTIDIHWAKSTLKELLRRKPVDPVSSDSHDRSSTSDGDDTDLCHGLSDDQEKAFQHAIKCFDDNETLRMFVHGGPGTGKSFLAEKIMVAAVRRGLVSRFTALSGAAATVNGGTTIHYIARLPKFCSWGRPPDANSVKLIHERSRGT